MSNDRQGRSPLPDAAGESRLLGNPPLIGSGARILTTLVVLAVSFVTFHAAASVSLPLSHQSADLALVWYANAVGTVLLLALPRRSWPQALLGIALANVAAGYPFSGDPLASLSFLPANLLEVFLGAWLLRRFVRVDRALSSPHTLLGALALGSLVPAIVGASVGSAALALRLDASYVSTWAHWFEGTLIGGVSVLPFGFCLLHFGAREVLARLAAPAAAALAVLVIVLGTATMHYLPHAYAWLGGLLMLCMLRTCIVGGTFLGLMVSLATEVVLMPRLAAQRLAAASEPDVHLLLPLALTLLPAMVLATVLRGLRGSVAALAEQRRHAAELYKRSPALLHAIDADGRLVDVSDFWLERLGYRREEVIGRQATDFLTDESREYALKVTLPEVLRTGRCRDVPYGMVRRDGSVVDVTMSAIVERDEAGEPLRLLGYLEDVSEEKRLGRALEAEHELLEVTLRCIGDGVLTTDQDGVINYVNPVAETLIGASLDELAGRPFAEAIELVDGKRGLPIDDPIEACLQRRGLMKLPPDTVLKSHLGTDVAVEDSVAPIFARNGTLRGAVMVFQDVTESRQQSERMAFLAHRDPLTGLANRFSLQTTLEETCTRAAGNDERFALVFLDVDHFKHVNDSLGHEKGDILLETIAERLQGCLRPGDTVARLGGDEFVLLLDRLDDVADAEAVTRAVLEGVARPVTLDGIEISVSVSLGAAMFPGDGESVDELMKRADMAMYRSKRLGRNRCHFYASALDAAAGERLKLEAELRQAVAGHGIVVHYQPIVDGSSHLADGVEALVRWQHPTQGLLGPDAFVPMAEESGLIVDLGRRVLEIACADHARLERAHGRAMYVSVNVSALQLASAGFADGVCEVLEANGLPGRKLLLEITESALMSDPEQSLESIRALKRLGVGIAIDDFGTGYSSLSHLRRFPVDVLKIDRSFVREIATSDANRAFIDAFIALSTRLRLTVIAEGVETVEQAHLLAALGCSRLQGYLFSRPEPLAEEEPAPYRSRSLPRPLAARHASLDA